MSLNPSKKMRILYLMTDPFRVGGVQKALKVLGPHFVRMGHEVYIACPEGDQLKYLIEAGVHHIPFSVHFRTPAQFREQAASLRALIETINPTVLAPQSLRSSLLCYTAAKDMPLIRVTTVHNIHTPVNVIFAGVLLNRCSHLSIFESDHEYRRVTQLGLAPRKACVIPGGVDTDIFHKTEKPSGLLNIFPDRTQDTVIFGCVARLSGQKGHNDLFKAFAMVVRQAPAARLVLVGDGPLKQDLLNQVSKLGISPFVYFAGQQSNIPEYLNLFDVFVLASSSIKESLPWAIREAMACGLPVIATKIGANHELIRHRANGFLITPQKPKQLADAMLSMISEPSLRIRMGEKSLQMIQNHRFRQDVWLDANEKIYIQASSLAGHPVETAGDVFLKNKEESPC